MSTFPANTFRMCPACLSEGDKMSKPLFSPELTTFYTRQKQIKLSVEPLLLSDKKVTYQIIICTFMRAHV
jgi:hypothetical protein